MTAPVIPAVLEKGSSVNPTPEKPGLRRRARALWLALPAVFIVLAAATFGWASDSYEKLRVLAKVFQVVSENYVEPVTFDELVNNALRGVLEHLDPHSSYITKEEFNSFQETTTGRFGGLGMEVTVRDGILTVVAPIEDTPASRAGLQTNDRIVTIDGQSTADLRLDEAVGLLKGEPGSKVVIGVIREGWDQPREFTLTREIIKTKSVRHKMLDPGYGYIRLSVFQEDSGGEVDNAIDKLAEENGASLLGLVLDLRQNPGGLLNEAVAVADIFLESGIIVSTQGRDPSKKDQRAATPNKKKRDFPLILLIDGGSASASEILAGALQDHGRAVLLGRPSFGKGSVQTIIKLDDGSGLRLTTALYYTPSGRLIQAKGIEPDFLVSQVTTPDEPAFTGLRRREKDLRDHIPNGKESATKKSTEETAPWWQGDPQLARAVELIEGYSLFDRMRQAPAAQ